MAPSPGKHGEERRYLLCEGYGSPPSAPLGKLGRLKVFAASLAGRDLLRLAIFLDRPQNWTVALPHPSGRPWPFAEAVQDWTPQGAVDMTRMTGMSEEDYRGERRALRRFAKCFGHALEPRATSVRCEVRGSGKLQEGRLQLFDNGELRHNFVRCGLPPPPEGGAPERLPVSLHLHLFSGPDARVDFELCRVREPRQPLAFCTLPLYGLPKLKAAIPGVLDGWLAHHLGNLGFSRAEIYGIDGSFEEDLRRWRERGFAIRYHGSFPAWLSPELGKISQAFQGCAESMAYAHCLTRQRALSRWVLLLHGPDEYLSPGYPAVPLEETVEWLSAQAGHHVAQITVRSWPFGRRGLAEGSDEPGPAAVLAASRARSARLDESMHTPLLDPERCTCSGAHACVSEKGYLHGNATEARVRMLVTHHYVEMLPWDRGRCDRLHNGAAPCVVPDDSLQWAAERLREGQLG